MKFKIGDLVVFQKPHMNSYKWRREKSPYLTAIVIKTDGADRNNTFYNVHAANGRTYWDIREDRLAILAKVKD